MSRLFFAYAPIKQILQLSQFNNNKELLFCYPWKTRYCFFFLYRVELKEWAELMIGLSPAEQRGQLTSLGVATARGIVASSQATHLHLTQHNAHLQVPVFHL
jgi:hypothetical protein